MQEADFSVGRAHRAPFDQWTFFCLKKLICFGVHVSFLIFYCTCVELLTIHGHRFSILSMSAVYEPKVFVLLLL